MFIMLVPSDDRSIEKSNAIKSNLIIFTCPFLCVNLSVQLKVNLRSSMKNQITKKILDISELAKMTGMPASAIRYYDDNKLIRSLGRKGLKRLFDISTAEQLKFISLGQQAGFSLDEIKEMFQETGKYNVNRELVLKKADDISITIKRLIATRKGLIHVAKCSATNHFECPKFIRLLDLAGKKRTRSK